MELSLLKLGEFTKRAFLNGRIDLSQAEAIIDIINAKTEKEAKASVKQLKGYLSEKLHKIREKNQRKQKNKKDAYYAADSAIIPL